MTARMRLAGPLLTWACLLVVAPPAAPAAAQDARVTNDVDTTLVTVGDRIQMTVTVEHGVGTLVNERMLMAAHAVADAAEKGSRGGGHRDPIGSPRDLADAPAEQRRARTAGRISFSMRRVSRI